MGAAVRPGPSKMLALRRLLGITDIVQLFSSASDALAPPTYEGKLARQHKDQEQEKSRLKNRPIAIYR